MSAASEAIATQGKAFVTMFEHPPVPFQTRADAVNESLHDLSCEATVRL